MNEIESVSTPMPVVRPQQEAVNLEAHEEAKLSLEGDTQTLFNKYTVVVPPEEQPPPSPPSGTMERFVMTLPPPQTFQAERCMHIAFDALSMFVHKNAAYGEPEAGDLGARGQYADMHRKWKRLRKHLWEGMPWPEEGESFDQVMMEFIGHILLTIDFKDQEHR